MSRAFPFPESVKADLRRASASGGYALATEILERGGAGELVLESAQEAQVVVNVARVALMTAALRHPFWDEDHPRHDQAHEEAFQEVLLAVFEKTVSYIGQEFEVTTAI